MKKFCFSLEKVLEYKQETVDVLRIEYTVSLQKVQQQEVVRACETQHAQLNCECREKEKTGMSISEARMFEMGLQMLQKAIEDEKKSLSRLQEAADAKREELIQSKQEAAAIDKLKGRKLTQYQAEQHKSEEKVIDDLICARLCCR